MRWRSWLPLGFASLVGWLLVEKFRDLDFDQLRSGMAAMDPWISGSNLLLVAINYLILTSFDYAAFRHLRQAGMTYGKVLWSAFICYACTLNFGALVGGLGFRYRVYSKWHVPRKRIPDVIIFAVVANWSGYMLLLGAALVARPPVLENVLPSWATLALGLAALTAVALYLALCAQGTSFRWKLTSYRLPSIGLALGELGLAVLQWSILGGIILRFLAGAGT